MRTLLVALLLLAVDRVSAGTAAFTPDGRVLYFAGGEYQPGLHEARLESGEVRPLPLSLPDGPPLAMARNPDGSFLLATAHALHTWNPGSPPVRRAEGRTEEDQLNLTDLDVHPATGTAVILATRKRSRANSSSGPLLYFLAPQDRRLSLIFHRHGNEPLAPAFAPDGQLHFSSAGDPWITGLEIGDEGDAGSFRAFVAGRRVAPLALLATHLSNEPCERVTGIAATRRHLFLMMARNDERILVRVPAPERDEPSSRNEDWNQMAELLRAARVVATFHLALPDCLAPTPARDGVICLASPIPDDPTEASEADPRKPELRLFMDTGETRIACRIPDDWNKR